MKKGAEKIWRFCDEVWRLDTVWVLVELGGIQCTVDTGFRLVRHGFFWRAEYPLAWWSHAWRGWRTSWCLRTSRPSKPRWPLAKRQWQRSGTWNAKKMLIILNTIKNWRQQYYFLSFLFSVSTNFSPRYFFKTGITSSSFLKKIIGIFSENCFSAKFFDKKG